MFIIYIIKRIINKIHLRNELCDRFIFQIDYLLKDINLLFADLDSFIEPNVEYEWRNKNKNLINDISSIDFKSIYKAKNYKLLLNKHSELFKKINSLKEQILIFNNLVAENKIQSAYNLIGKVEGQFLDKQQMNCVVKNSYNQLVIAGAGTGKTTTIIGKIKYLVKSGMCKPEDILALSFTNAAASEMGERIKTETGFNVDALTFHKLGFNIITEVNEKKPKISKLNLHNYIKNQLLDNMKSNSYLDVLSNYLLYNKFVHKSEFEFTTKKEYDEYLEMNPPTTIDNQTVRSYGELDIANFLFQNGISYIYECPYEIDTSTKEYGQYYPDFYLPDYKIYIEYFGIDKQGNVPSYFKSSNGISATQKYHDSMEWKRKLHKENNTTLIECYAYEKSDGVLLDNLKNKLIDRNVVLSPKSAETLWEEISSEENFSLDAIIELFETVINLIKSNEYSIDYVRKLNCNNYNSEWNEKILSLIEPIYNSYNSYLAENEEIDFNDMINLAKEYVDSGKYIHNYKFVIVDEYQDISKARFNLLNSMRKSNKFNLFCVGDDWQSIYRFAGSDIGFIINFEEYWGATDVDKIETTYRFSDKLIDISSNFIMKNPMQKRKNIKGKSGERFFPLGEICGYTDEYAIKFMSQRLNELPLKSTVFFIGRYSFDVNLLKYDADFKCQYNNVSGFIDVIYKKRLDLKIQFLTVHKSKGLQADYVFIINNKKSRMGFPSKIQDSPILFLLLDNCDSFPYAEERRLFYVALTRAKKKVLLITVEKHISQFAMELKEKYDKQIKEEKWQCPLCGGKLVKRNGPYGEFFGCSNYRKSGCRYIRKINH